LKKSLDAIKNFRFRADVFASYFFRAGERAVRNDILDFFWAGGRPIKAF